MIGILAGTAEDAERIRRAADGDVRIVKTKDELRACCDGLDCLIVGCRSGSLWKRTQLLSELEQELPLVPIILVTDRDLNVARVLCGVKLSALVWFDDLRTRLQSEIETACHTTALSHLADVIRRSALPAALRTALAYSLRAARSMPVRSVEDLAHAVHRSPATLSQHFRTHTTGATTLSRFLGALVLLRAHQLRLSGTSWENAARQLGFVRATLTRKCRRWPGCTLGRLELVAPNLLLAAFVAEYVQPLLAATDPESLKRPAEPDHPPTI